MKRHILKSLVLQHGQYDCGVACLLSIIKYHGGEASLESLRQLSGTTINGTTMLGLYQAAKQHGFDAEGLQADGVDNLKELSNPAILNVLVDNRVSHYLVLYGFEHDELIIGDPSKGVTKYSREQINEIWATKTLLKLTPNNNFEKGRKIRIKKREWIKSLLIDDLSLLFTSLFLGLIISGLGLTTAIFSQKLIDTILPELDITSLLVSLGLVLFLLLARIGLNYLRGLFMIRQGFEFNNRIIQTFYGSMLLLPKTFYDSRKTGEIVSRMNDTRRIQSVLAVLTGSLLIDFLFVIISISYVFAYSTIIGLVSIGTILIYVTILFRFNKPIFVKQNEVMESYAHSESNLVDTILGVADIKLSNRLNFFEKVNSIVYGKFQQKNFELGKLGLKFGTVSDVIGVIFIISVFGIASSLVISAELLLGELVALIGMASGIIPSATRLVIANIQIQEANIAFNRMFEFTGIEKEVQDGKLLNNGTINEIIIKEVSFRFPGRKQILSNVSVEVRKGEMIALLGESGSGKSTLIQLIQKFYRCESGSIIFDGTDSDDLSTQDVRRCIGSVPQEQRIFNGNLLYNITLSDNKEEFESAILFCQQYGFDKFFVSFPQGYLTLLGEEGVNISGGQKQMVVIVRALFRKPSILLLDEATSAMDRMTENFVLSLIQRLKETMSIVMVTHRIKIAQMCDRIYILDSGKISNVGTPSDLLKTSNFYSDSYRELVKLSSL